MCGEYRVGRKPWVLLWRKPCKERVSGFCTLRIIWVLCSEECHETCCWSLATWSTVPYGVFLCLRLSFALQGRGCEIKKLLLNGTHLLCTSSCYQHDLWMLCEVGCLGCYVGQWKRATGLSACEQPGHLSIRLWRSVCPYQNGRPWALFCSSMLGPRLSCTTLIKIEVESRLSGACMLGFK